jgi:hypothetical protein
MATQKSDEEIKITGEAEPTKEPRRTTPDVESDFEALLKDYGLAEKAATIITKHIADTGTSKIFENPMELLQKLAKFPRQIPPVTRKNILDHWIAQNRIPVPKEYEADADKPAEELRRRGPKEEAEESKYAVDTDSGQIRVASTTDKTALTWDEADKLSKNIEKKSTEKERKSAEKERKSAAREVTKVTYIYDSVDKVVRMAKEGEQGGTLEQAKELKNMAEEGKKGEPPDPLEVMAQSAERVEALRKVFGGGSTLPAWMTDPVTFANAMKTVMGVSGEDSAVKAAITAMQKTIEEMKEDRWQAQFDAQQKQLQDLTGVLNKTLEAIGDMKKERVGRTEMDIIHEIADKGIELAKTELPGLRRDIKEAISSIAPPPGKTFEQREDRKKKFKQAIDTDQEIEELGRRVFFQED